MCLEQKVYASQKKFTQPLVVMVETFRRSGQQPSIRARGRNTQSAQTYIGLYPGLWLLTSQTKSKLIETFLLSVIYFEVPPGNNILSELYQYTRVSLNVLF